MGARGASIHRIETPEDKAQRLATENESLRAENLLLKQKLDALSRRLFGKSSEQLDPNQLQLLLQGLEEPKKPQASSDETSAPEEADGAKRKKAKAKNKSRIKGLDALETEEQILLPAEYEANPEAYEIIGQKVTELLDYRPARCIRQIIKRVKVRLKDNRNQPPILAPAPTTPLVGVTSQFQPRYRPHYWEIRRPPPALPSTRHPPTQRHQHPARHPQSLDPAAASACSSPWQKPFTEKPSPPNYLQGDETPLRLLAPGTGKTATSYFWVFNDPSGSISYHWILTRQSRRHPSQSGQTHPRPPQKDRSRPQTPQLSAKSYGAGHQLCPRAVVRSRRLLERRTRRARQQPHRKRDTTHQTRAKKLAFSRLRTRRPIRRRRLHAHRELQPLLTQPARIFGEHDESGH